MTGFATFTTSGSVVANILGYQLSGTGPHVVGAADLAQVVAELTAGGETITAQKIRYIEKIPAIAAGADTSIPVFNSVCQTVIGAASLIAAVNIIGAATSYNTYSLYTYDTGGTVSGTPAAYSGTAGTLVANTKTAMTVTGGTVSANHTVVFSRATAASGTATSDILLLIDFTL